MCTDDFLSERLVRGSSRDYRLDLKTRYFLRRLAIARAQPRKLKDPKFPHRDALAELVLIVWGLPLIALLSFVCILDLKWQWFPLSWWPSRMGFTLFIFLLGIPILFFGYRWFGPRYEKYLRDPSAAMQFDTERDRRIVAWQRLGMAVVCGVVTPVVAIAIAFWPELLKMMRS